MYRYCEVCNSKVCCLFACECTFRGFQFLFAALLCCLVGDYIDKKSDYYIMAQCYYGVAILLCVFGVVLVALICKRKKIIEERVYVEFEQ